MSKTQKNIDRLVDLVSTVLRSKGTTQAVDGYGNLVHIDCNIYDDSALESFLHLSLSEFNQTPDFTHFTFGDTKVIELFTQVLVEGAILYALSSQALLERGREFQTTNGGVVFKAPDVSDLLNTQYSTLLGFHIDKVKFIKSQIKSL